MSHICVLRVCVCVSVCNGSWGEGERTREKEPAGEEEGGGWRRGLQNMVYGYSHPGRAASLQYEFVFLPIRT